MHRIFASLIGVCVIVAFTACSSGPKPGRPAPAPTGVYDFKSCVAAGYPVLKTFPPKCVGKDGKTYTNEVIRNIGGKACKDTCGDGVCAQIVCSAEGCPCAETPENCARDCAEGSF